VRKALLKIVPKWFVHILSTNVSPASGAKCKGNLHRSPAAYTKHAKVKSLYTLRSLLFSNARTSQNTNWRHSKDGRQLKKNLASIIGLAIMHWQLIFVHWENFCVLRNINSCTDNLHISALKNTFVLWKKHCALKNIFVHWKTYLCTTKYFCAMKITFLH